MVLSSSLNADRVRVHLIGNHRTGIDRANPDIRVAEDAVAFDGIGGRCELAKTEALATLD